jgi:hypothetical protein
MPRRRPDRQPPDRDGTTPPADKRGGYTGAEDAANMPPPQRVPSAYLPATAPAPRR